MYNRFSEEVNRFTTRTTPLAGPKIPNTAATLHLSKLNDSWEQRQNGVRLLILRGSIHRLPTAAILVRSLYESDSNVLP